MSKYLKYLSAFRLLANLSTSPKLVQTALVFLLAAFFIFLPVQQVQAATPTIQFSQPCGNIGVPGQVHHIIWIWMENESYNKIIGNSAAPYQNSLASQCGVATNFYNESHGSLSNYIAATDGQSPLGTTFLKDCLPNASADYCVSHNANIFSEAESSGGSWRGYAEDMPTNCNVTNTGNYAARHNPSVYYPELRNCATYDIPMGDITTQTGQFYDDVRNGNLPSFTFVTPNLVNDAHNSDVTTGDTWLSELIPFIINNANYQNGDTIIFITNDEGGGTDTTNGEDCANQSLSASQPSCHIPTIVLAPYMTSGTADNTFYTHYSMLKTAEELLGYPLLGLAQSANSMATAFNLGPTQDILPTPPTSPTNLTAIAVSSSQVNLTWNVSTTGTFPISGYQIVRNGTVIATTTTTSYTDLSTVGSTSYTYTVNAIDTANDPSSSSNAAIVTTPAQPPTQLLSNPGFENWTSGLPAGWSTYGPATALTQITDAHSGSYSVGVATTKTTYAASGVNAVNGSKPLVSSTSAGVTYTGSCWVKANKIITLNIQLHETTPSGASVSAAAISSLKVPAANTWYQIQVNYTPIANGDYLPFSIYSTNTIAGGATFQIDDCSLTIPATNNIIPPTTPTNLTATATSSSQVNLSWTASTAGSAPISGYQIVRNGAIIATTSNTTYSDTTVTANTTYSYTVAAIDTANNTSSLSNVATVTTPVQAPSNLLTNSDFESWTVGLPIGWSTYGPSTTLTQLVNAQSGTYSVGVATTSTSYAASGINAANGSKSLISSTTAGTSYTGSCWVKASKIITLNIQLHEVTQNWASVSPAAITSLKVPAANTWYQMQVSYTTIGNGNMLPFTIYSTNTISGGATFQVDNCSLKTN